MSGQPGGNVNWVFDLQSVEIIEQGGITPSLIINQPNTFILRATVTNTGPMSGILTGATGFINYHCERHEQPVPGIPERVTLGPVNFTMGGDPTVVDSIPFTSAGPAGPNGLDRGTWHIFAHVHFNPPFANQVVAFYDFKLMIVQ